MTKKFSSRVAKNIGDEHELAGDRQGQPAIEHEMDLHNNERGRRVGIIKEDCDKGCKNFLFKQKESSLALWYIKSYPTRIIFNKAK